VNEEEDEDDAGNGGIKIRIKSMIKRIAVGNQRFAE
jgi:hypothetical protein